MENFKNWSNWNKLFLIIGVIVVFVLFMTILGGLSTFIGAFVATRWIILFFIESSEVDELTHKENNAEETN